MVAARITTLTAALASSTAFLPAAVHATYTLTDSYTASNWFSSFNFFSDKDPTNGFVQYKDLKSAAASGLVAISNPGAPNAAVYMGVDHTTKDPAGRASVRLSSKKTYNHGLFVFDVEHNPGSICGTWPAFWLLSAGGKWPLGGEIDVFEGVNDQVGNKMTLHTTAGCAIKPTTGFTGKIDTPDCDVNAQGQGKNMGCGILPPPETHARTYGKGMNEVGGGVYATAWTSREISIYHFPRSKVPGDISAGRPDPSKWGMPVAKFAGGCNIDEHFKDLSIIFNTAFCGDWAGEAWKASTTCSKKAPTCQAYVRDNPEAFKEAYWMIRSVKVYSEQGGSNSTTATRRSIDGTETAPEAAVVGHTEEKRDDKSERFRKIPSLLADRCRTRCWGNSKGMNGVLDAQGKCQCKPIDRPIATGPPPPPPGHPTATPEQTSCKKSCGSRGVMMLTGKGDSCICNQPPRPPGTKRDVDAPEVQEDFDNFLDEADLENVDAPLLAERSMFSDAWADLKHVWKCVQGKCKREEKRDLPEADEPEESPAYDEADTKEVYTLSEVADSDNNEMHLAKRN
ncbi:MAG: hypothetical protein LQ346_008758 [Caloplaca aetnensis]|nr:MAG: hypothetical protein LQ346_008758 [Caloplaca aetnensis]